MPIYNIFNRKLELNNFALKITMANWKWWILIEIQS